MVGLVQHHGVGAVEPQIALLHMVEQAAGGGDEHVQAARKRLHLGAKADAAENGGDAQPGEAAIGPETVADLGGQFAGRGEHENAGLLGAGMFGIVRAAG